MQNSAANSAAEPGSETDNANPAQRAAYKRPSQQKKTMTLSEALLDQDEKIKLTRDPFLSYTTVTEVDEVLEALHTLCNVRMFMPEEFFWPKNLPSLAVLYKYSPADWGLIRTLLPKKTSFKARVEYRI